MMCAYFRSMLRSIIALTLCICSLSPLTAQWDYYEATWEGKPGSVIINMDWRQYAPVDDLPYLLEIVTDITDCPTARDGIGHILEDIDILSNQLDSAISLITYIESVGTMTHDCKVRDFYYINDTTKVRQSVSKVATTLQSTLRMVPDEKWRGYLQFLYPDAYLQQTMINAKIVKELIRLGEDVQQIRRLMHYAGFTTPGEREKYRTFILEQGFRIEDEIHDHESLAPYQFIFSRRDKTAIDWISDITLKLSDRAAELNGAYDGWEIEVTDR